MQKFTDYLLGLHFLMETDHKPLVPLLGTQESGQTPTQSSAVSSEDVKVQLLN